MQFLKWNKAEDLPSKIYYCGYCGSQIASNYGFVSSAESLLGGQHYVYICQFCCEPTYFRSDGSQFPAAPCGQNVRFLPTAEVEELYNEARAAFSAKAYTSSVLCCRKLLMHVAVSKGAPPGLAFAEYVDYLNGNGYVSPDGQGWIEHVQKKGKDAAHEIEIMTRQDAEDLIVFVESLLKSIYEYPGMLADRKRQKP